MEASAITRRRVTHSSERWDCTHIERDEHDPISLGAAEQAAWTDQHTRHAGPTWTRPDRGTSGWTPGVGRHTCTYKVSKAGRPRSHLRMADRGRTPNTRHCFAAHSHAHPRLGWEVPVSQYSLSSHNERGRPRQLEMRGTAVRTCARSAHACAVRGHGPGSAGTSPWRRGHCSARQHVSAHIVALSTELALQRARGRVATRGIPSCRSRGDLSNGVRRSGGRAG